MITPTDAASGKPGVLKPGVEFAMRVRLAESDFRALALGIAQLTVDDLVTVKASTFNSNQQFSTRSMQQVRASEPTLSWNQFSLIDGVGKLSMRDNAGLLNPRLKLTSRWSNVRTTTVLIEVDVATFSG